MTTAMRWSSQVWTNTVSPKMEKLTNKSSSLPQQLKSNQYLSKQIALKMVEISVRKMHLRWTHMINLWDYLEVAIKVYKMINKIK